MLKVAVVASFIALSVTTARPAAAQGPGGSQPIVWNAVATVPATQPPAVVAAMPGSAPGFRTLVGSSLRESPRHPASINGGLRLVSVPSTRRRHNALVGGLIGAATGIIGCTVISNIAKDPGTGFSTCDTLAYLGFGAGGFAVGAVVGSLIK